MGPVIKNRSEFLDVNERESVCTYVRLYVRVYVYVCVYRYVYSYFLSYVQVAMYVFNAF